MRLELCTQKGCNGDLFKIQVDYGVPPQIRIGETPVLVNESLHIMWCRDRMFARRVLGIRGIADISFAGDSLNLHIVPWIGWEAVRPELMERLEFFCSPDQGEFLNTGTGKDYFTGRDPQITYYVGLEFANLPVMAA